MARQCTDIDEILRSINQRLRKLEKSDSEKTEEIGRLNRVICQKDKEIHNLKVELASSKSDLADAKTRIKEPEGEEPDEEDDYSNLLEKTEKPIIKLKNIKYRIKTAKTLAFRGCHVVSLCFKPRMISKTRKKPLNQKSNK